MNPLIAVVTGGTRGIGLGIAEALVKRNASVAVTYHENDAAAKKDLAAGDVLDGEGGFTVYGRLVRAEACLQNAYLPMGLTGNARLIRPVAKDAILTYADVELDESLLSFTLRKVMEAENRAKLF